MTLDAALRYVTWAVYLGVFVLVLRRALRTPTPAHRDMTLFFGAAAVLVVVITVQTLLGVAMPRWLGVAAGAVAVTLPYLLLRLVAHFARTPAWLSRAAEAGLAVIVGLLIVAPEPTPPVVAAVLAVYFVGVAGYDTAALHRQARRTAGVTSRRMQAAALGSLALCGAVLAAFLSALDPTRGEAWTVASRVLALTSAIGYYVGFAPPAWLRRAWQTPALQAFLDDMTRLPYLPELPSVLTELEAHTTAVIGAPMASIGLAQGTQPVLRFWRGLGGRTTTTTAEHQSLIPNIRASVETIDIAPDALFAGRAFLQQRPVFSANIRREDPTNAAMYAVLDIQAVLAAPISAGDRQLGVLTLWAPRAPVFAESDLELLQLLARQVAVVLESRTLLQEVAAARAHDQAEDLKDRFLASISHDLRNPLTAAAVRAQLLRRRLDRLGSVAYDELHDGLRSIEKSHAQMARLIDQLLDYARLQLDRPLELNREPIDLVEMVRDVVASHASTSDRHQVQLEPDVRSLVGQWDRDRLERVLQNVMSNAIKYSPAGGVIRVAIRHEQSAPEAWATVIVEDHGLGIPSAELPRIFEGFHRAANVSGQIAGTGIGLATARDVVERHGGEIIVDSEEGRGSTFTIRLPVIPPGADRDEDGLSEG